MPRRPTAELASADELSRAGMTTDMSLARSARPRLAKLLAPLILTALTLALFDLIGYFLVPSSYTTFAPSYRNFRLLSPPSTSRPELTRNYPRYYHRPDDVLGFDISPGARAMAEVDDHPYEIFA